MGRYRPRGSKSQRIIGKAVGKSINGSDLSSCSSSPGCFIIIGLLVLLVLSVLLSNGNTDLAMKIFFSLIAAIIILPLGYMLIASNNKIKSNAKIIIIITIVILALSGLIANAIVKNKELTDKLEKGVYLSNLDYYISHEIKSASSYSIYITLDDEFDNLSIDEKIDVARDYFKKYENHITVYAHLYKNKNEENYFYLKDLTLNFSTSINNYRLHHLSFYDSDGKSYDFNLKSDTEKKNEEEAYNKFKEELKNKIPYDGLKDYYVESTKWGKADEIELCTDYDNKRPSHQSKDYYWYEDNGDSIHFKSVHILNGEVIDVSEHDLNKKIMDKQRLNEILNIIN